MALWCRCLAGDAKLLSPPGRITRLSVSGDGRSHPDHEIVRYDFSKPPGSWLDAFVLGTDTVDITIGLESGVYKIFGQRRPYLEFRWLVRGTNRPRREYVYDSVGASQAFNLDVMPGFRLELQGAVLNGVTYGTVITSAGDKGLGVVSDFGLFQNYPNPFNPTTTVRYALPHRSHVTLTICNTLGQKVALLVNGEVDAGYHTVQFDGSNLASGTYFYRLQAGSYTDTKNLLLVR